MTSTDIVAVITAAASLVAAMTALVRELRTRQQLQAHIAGAMGSVARAAQCGESDHVIEE